ncbi:MAG TPA: DUF4136 domain-containing protein [Bryobacteraceae bacterium]|jgi:hypothetical protein
MKLVRVILPLSLLAICGFAQDVRYNFDKNAKFSDFKTYRWVQIKDAPPMNNLVDQQVKQSIDAELAKKGLQRTDGEQADLYIAYQVTVNQEKEFSSYSTDFGYGPGWGRGWYGGGMGSTMTTGQTSTIHIGELALDMYDPGSKKLVWRGTASKTLDAKAKPEKRQKNLGKGVAKLLKNYPPPPPKS